MTQKEIEDIRSWRRGEWVADITEIESMVYGLVDELDRLRGAAEKLEAKLVECRELAQQRVDKLFREEGTEWMAHEDEGRRQGYNGAIIVGRELGLFKDKP